jgi:tetratricopeptide (TPR) repeat protein
MMRGLLWANLGDWPVAEAEYERMLPNFREEGDWRNVAYALNNLGEVLLRQGRQAEARDAFQRSVEIKRRLNDEQALGQGSLWVIWLRLTSYLAILERRPGV